MKLETHPETENTGKIESSEATATAGLALCHEKGVTGAVAGPGINGSDRPKSIAAGTLGIAGRDIECHVLSNAMRVLDTSHAQAVFGASKNRMFRRSLARIPGVSEDMQAHPSVEFVRPDGRAIAYGYETKFITRICIAYQVAFLAGNLHPKQIPIAREAMVFVAACADSGLEALVDAATGYQATDRLINFERYLREYQQTWQERWNGDVVRAFCRLYGKPVSIEYPKFMQSIAGRVYDILIGGPVMAKLRQKNPAPGKGHNHHQFFTEEMQNFLERELYVIQAMAETSQSKSRFWNSMDVRYRGDSLQTDFLS